jgi:hypothetical protein
VDQVEQLSYSDAGVHVAVVSYQINEGNPSLLSVTVKSAS